MVRTPASRLRLSLALWALALGASGAWAQDEGRVPGKNLLEARLGFKTKLLRQERDEEAPERPHPGLFSLVSFKGPAGQLQAYLGKPPGPGKHPAIVWITGGFPPGGAGSFAWEPSDPDNDQSAQAYRHAGLIMMYPFLRGAGGNPGVQEGFFGEVDDVLAAAEYLSQAPGVDPQRIYLGGHSTGGTLALLVAAASDRFKAVISFGPVDDPAGYGADVLPYDPQDAQEARLRAPIHFLGAIRSPTFVIEGTERGNYESLQALEKASQNPLLRCLPVRGADHFDVLAPSNALIARRLAALEAGGTLQLDALDLAKALESRRRADREADDLQTLAELRRDEVDLRAAHALRWIVLGREEKALQRAGKDAQGLGFEAEPLVKESDREGRPYFVLRLKRSLTLTDLPALFASSAAVADLARKAELQYAGWERAE